MKKKLLSLAVAALTFAACDEGPTYRPAPVSSAMKKDAGHVASVIPNKTVELPTPVVVADPPQPPVAIDPLAVQHDEPKADHLARSAQLESEGNVKGALTEARRAIFTSPEDVDALKRIAKLGARLGQFELAADAQARLATAFPDDAQPLIAESRLRTRGKDFVRAITAAEGAISRDATNPEGFQAKGLAELAAGELKSAIDSFETAVQLKPDHGWALNNLGLACLRANQNDRAVEVLEQAAELLPNVAYVHNNLGVALERVGRTDDAKQAYSTATLLSPKYVKARVNAERVARVQLENDATHEMLEETMSDVPHAGPSPTP